MITRRFLTFSAIFLLAACSTQRAEIKTWWGAHGKADVSATAALLSQEAAQIAQNTVYAKGLDATDVVLKNANVQGFGDGLRTLETGLPAAAIGQIPDFVMRLRQIWLPSQTHYTDLAANLGTIIQAETSRLETQTGKKLTSDQAKQIIEGLIAGLQSPPVALKGP